MRIATKIALVAILASVVAAPPLAHAAYRGHHHGWHSRHHYGWYRHGYAPAVSDYYHNSRMLAGTR